MQGTPGLGCAHHREEDAVKVLLIHCELLLKCSLRSVINIERTRQHQGNAMAAGQGAGDGWGGEEFSRAFLQSVTNVSSRRNVAILRR